MSFDDLAFPNGGASSSGAQVRKRCPACEEERQVAQSEWVCPACGERLLPAQPQFGVPDAQGNAMLRQLMSGMAAAASSSDSIDAGAGGGGEEGAASVAAQLQSLFIPSLNSTYASMAAAQQGLSIEELMTRLLQDSSLHTSSPVSKAFLEALKPRPLVARDFLQAYLRFEHLPGMQRDVFPTIAGFGAAGRYIQEHAQAQAEEKSAEAAAEAAATAAPATTSPAAEANATAAAATANAAPAAATPSAASASSSTVPAPAASVRPPPAPRSHSSGVLLVSSPLSLAPPPLRNGRLFRGRWVLAERGVSSFVAKARAAQDLMAKGLIIIQTEPDDKAWPFTMSDTNKTGGDIIIPCVMISQSDGAALQAALATSSSTSEAEAASVTLLTRERPLACCVCREDYEIGSEVVELPCSHFFCMDCILPWLKSRSNCPLCRFALPTEAPKQQADPPGPDSNQSQLRRDMYT